MYLALLFVRSARCLCSGRTILCGFSKGPQVRPSSQSTQPSSFLFSAKATHTAITSQAAPGYPRTLDPWWIIQPTRLRPFPHLLPPSTACLLLFYYSFASITQGPMRETKGRETQMIPLCYWLAPIKCSNNWPNLGISGGPFVPVP